MVIAEAQSQLPVDIRLIGGVCCAKDSGDPAEGFDDVIDLLAGEAGRRGLYPFACPCEGGDCLGTFGLGLVDPAGDEDGVGAGFQGSAVLGQLAVAGGDLSAVRVGGG
ncbi:hypothetical protein ND748_09060 [Frankia sp. AiPs1]|uniref:hypothetical protein n=1 Tax=Frankia sp. AiPs1 TaxID=573493 RepID=UPI002043957E|nr:hypothetical protein [Frankia sp. AiPs1]MCM3921808.1 hypothetical protein [Frankia sp. AiPs1]